MHEGSVTGVLDNNETSRARQEEIMWFASGGKKMQKINENKIGAGSNPVVVFFKNNMGILIALLALCAVLSIATDSF